MTAKRLGPDLADTFVSHPVHCCPHTDLDPEAAGLGDDGLLNLDLDPQLEALLGDEGAAGRRRGVAADIALEDGAYR